MRQCVVQVTRQAQPFARHRGVPCVVRQAFDACGALDHARIEFGVERLQRALFLLEIRHHLGQRGTDAADLVLARRDGERLQRPTAHAQGLPGQR